MKSNGGWLFGIFFGAVLTCAPVIAVLFIPWGVKHAFDALGASGISTPSALAHSISRLLMLGAAGLLLCPAGIVLTVIR